MNKKLLRILPYLFASGMAISDIFSFNEENYDLSPEELKYKRELEKKLNLAKKRERLLSRGLSEFEIDGIKVIALNYKNALRKINNLKKLI